MPSLRNVELFSEEDYDIKYKESKIIQAVKG